MRFDKLWRASVLLLVVACGETTPSAPLSPSAIAVVTAGPYMGTAGLPLADPVAFRVTGTDGQPLDGVQVSFAATGSGTATPATATTDAQGIAKTTWTLSRTAGANTLAASVGAINSTVAATGAAGRAATVANVTPTTLTAPAGSTIATPPSVRVSDAFGNPVANVTVTYALLSSGGTLVGPVVRTNAQGVATPGAWTLGAVAGNQLLVARVEEGGVTNNPIVFTAAATAGAATSLQAASSTNQTAAAGANVTPPSVRAVDALGNGVPNVTVTFAVTGGGGTLTPSTVVTDVSGVATLTRWTLGATAGTNTVVATSTGLGSVTFTATGAAGAATTLIAIAGDAQTAPAGRAVAIAPTVVARDAQGNPVGGVTVNFTVLAGGGTVIGGRQVTDASGTAQVGGWFLGTTPAINTLAASAAGLPAVNFTATSTAGAPAFVTVAAGDNQAAVVGTALGTPPRVRVTDASGNPVAGVTVAFAVTGGGGAITGATPVTDAQGQAAVGSWTLGNAGPNTLSATVTGVGSVTFSASVATTIAVTAAPAGPLTLGSNFQITVQLQNASGVSVPLAGIPLTLAIASGGGTLNGTAIVQTNANGTATFTVNVTGAAGARTFSIGGTGLTGGLTASITIN